ncbi:MAG: PRC-barrel domain-containing protein [Syntrophomonadales bacterium]|jgi:uncharacterized protein YrrD
MVKSRRLIGLPVIDEHRGTVLGRVMDIVISPRLQVEGLLVGSRDGKRLLLIDHLTIGQDAILVSDPRGLKRIKNGEHPTRIKDRMGLLVVNRDGRELGVMSDLVVEPESKEVQGIEISSGIIKDFIDGRSEVPLDKVANIGQGAMVINDEEVQA